MERKMRVRLLLDADKTWWVQSKRWWFLPWYFEKCFLGDQAYERAHFYARALKNPHTEEIT
jgi:hypothetical protein